MVAALAGCTLSLSLILVIGSQNAFVLKQGIKNQHVFIVCAICALSDAILISLGVAGFGAIVQSNPTIELIARYGGAIFLAAYAIFSFKSAFTSVDVLHSSQEETVSVRKSIGTALAFTWLNPHVYLDTLVLLGSISTQYQPRQWRFAAGATAGSLMFFFTLGYGARALAPLLKRPGAWRVLEFIVGVVMLVIAISLII